MTVRKTARKVATKKPAKKSAKKKVALVHRAIGRPSQITKKAPTKRLRTRRAKNTEPGYFPNPRMTHGIYENSKLIALAPSEALAQAIANTLQSHAQKGYFFRVHKI